MTKVRVEQAKKRELIVFEKGMNLQLKNTKRKTKQKIS
jgi:hypothetical protein